MRSNNTNTKTHPAKKKKKNKEVMPFRIWRHKGKKT